MTPARSVAASVVALGFASTIAAPMPASAAPAQCQRIEHFAAQAGAEVVRINRLDLGPLAGAAHREDAEASPPPSRSSRSAGSKGAHSKAGPDEDQDGPSSQPDPEDGPAPDGSAAKPGSDEDQDHSAPDDSADDLQSRQDRDQGGFAPAAWTPKNTTSRVRPDKDVPQSIGGVGLGDARSVLIADGPVTSAAAARVLDGRVAGSSARNDLVVQQAPPGNAKPTVRRTGEKRFGPLRAGAGELTAHARWDADMTCDSADAAVSRSAAELSGITVIGAGSDSLLRVPEKISGRSDTAVRQRAGRPESVASATMSAGQITLADGAVRIRVLRAPKLRVSMSPSGKGRVDYQPAVIEVTDQSGRVKRLDTVRDGFEMTLRDEALKLGSLPALIEPNGPLPLPPVAGLPSMGEPESTPAPGGADGTRLRISLGEVRQASKGNAIAARATAIKVSLVRDQGSEPTGHGYGPSAVVADVGVGVLEGAAVAPAAAAPGQGVSPAVAGAGGGLPITGPRAFSLLAAGAALLIGGVGAVLIASRRRRFNA